MIKNLDLNSDMFDGVSFIDFISKELLATYS